MRRITLAVALMGALAGCGGNVSPGSKNGQGTGTGTFTIRILNGQGQTRNAAGFLPTEMLGGAVTGSAGAINCASGSLAGCDSTPLAAGTSVVLTAIPSAPNQFLGWAGDCGTAGENLTCTVTANGGGSLFVVAMFGVDRTAHPSFADPSVHATNYLNFVNAAPGALTCTSCHGADLLGGGSGAPSCGSCHGWPMGKHFEASGHNSGVCARCHSGGGFRDLIGADGTPSNLASLQYTALAVAPGDKAALTTPVCDPAAVPPVTFDCYDANKKLGSSTVWYYASGMKCDMCHNTATILGGGTLTDKKFPSGKTVTLDSKSAICAQCHDGGRPGYEVSQLTLQIGATAADTQLSGTYATGKNNNATVRAHFLPAASTLVGGDASNWAEYTGAIYTAKNTHGGKNSCVDCHNPHTGELPADPQIEAKCGACHNDELTGLPVRTFAELEESRQFGFEGDIDGNGAAEPLAAEIAGMEGKLLAGIQAYAENVSGTKICYYDNRYKILADAAVACNTAPNNVDYNKYTPRLLKAAYNYLIAVNDAGAWAHNPRYAIEVIYDSIADLNVALAPLGKQVANGNRAFNGHFGAAEDPSPYAAMIYHGAANAVTGETLPNMGFTSDACLQCHGGKNGYATYLGVAPAALPVGTKDVVANKVNAMQCDTCHAFDGADMKDIRSDVAAVYFPPQKGATPAPAQKVVSFTAAQLPKSFAVCGTCHSGRENGASVDMAVTAGAKNPAGTTVAPATDADYVLGFKNPHYLGAAGMMLGSQAAMLYQYTGKTYSQTPAFWTLGANGPHGSPHGSACTNCHVPKGSKHTFEIDLATTVPPGTWGGAYPVAGMQPGAKNTAACDGCHAGPYALEPKAVEFEEAAEELLSAIKAKFAADLPAIQTYVNGFTFGGGTTGQPSLTLDGSTVTGICYDGLANPYVFFEVSGVCRSTGNATTTAVAAKLNPQLLKAAFNYQWTQKEPGAWAHNEFYAMQVIYDSIVDLGYTPSFKVAAVTDPVTHLPVAGDPLNRGY